MNLVTGPCFRLFDWPRRGVTYEIIIYVSRGVIPLEILDDRRRFYLQKKGSFFFIYFFFCASHFSIWIWNPSNAQRSVISYTTHIREPYIYTFLIGRRRACATPPSAARGKYRTEISERETRIRGPTDSRWRCFFFSYLGCVYVFIEKRHDAEYKVWAPFAPASESFRINLVERKIQFSPGAMMFSRSVLCQRHLVIPYQITVPFSFFFLSPPVLLYKSAPASPPLGSLFCFSSHPETRTSEGNRVIDS